MSDPDANGDLRITLKDLFLAQQEFSSKQVDAERKLSETFADLKITLIQIQNHMSAMDTRNSAADQLHLEHAKRISDLERIVDSQGLRTVREERQAIVADMERRFDLLEKGAIGSDAVRAYKSQAGSARTSARNMFWAMIIAIATAIGTIVALIVLIRTHG